MDKGKPGVPANYRYVVFKDISTDYTFKASSDGGSDQTIKWKDGNTYPLVHIDLSEVLPNISDITSKEVAASVNLNPTKK